jgi:uracil-DNA glycosylase
LNRLRLPLGRVLDEALAAGRLQGWRALLETWRCSDAGQALMAAVDARVEAGAVVYPARVFRAFELTPLESTRALILGQDPYHGAGQAEGLAFSVPSGQRLPPSLRNIFRERQRDLGLPLPTTGSLESWARDGVLLLNTSLTVEADSPGSHARLGWQALTDSVCGQLAVDAAPKAFLLWGAHAQGRAHLLSRGSGHLLLQSNHPSPLAATRPPVPFVGCGHFGLARQFLREAGRGRLAWD